MNLNHVQAEWEGVSGIASQATPRKDGRGKQEETGDGPRSCKVARGAELCPFSPR